MNKRKELVSQYKQMKHDMGIFMILCKASNKCDLTTSQKLNGKINRMKFQLEAGAHSCKELQKDWREFGSDNFSIEILEKLKYDKEESKTDYSEELDILQMVWEEKLSAENIKVY